MAVHPAPPYVQNMLENTEGKGLSVERVKKLRPGGSGQRPRSERAMELSSEQMGTLTAAAAATDAVELRSLTEFAAGALTLTDGTRAPGASGDGGAALAERVERDVAFQRLVGSVASLYAEAARAGAHVDELTFFLTADCDLGDERARAIAAVYGSYRESLLRVMSRHTADGALPELVGVSWKLSYTASSGSGDRFFEPSYSVTFQLRQPVHLSLGALTLVSGMGRKRPASWADDKISFLCSYEDMNSLVEQLNRACVSAELVASSRAS